MSLAMLPCLCKLIKNIDLPEYTTEIKLLGEILQLSPMTFPMESHYLRKKALYLDIQELDKKDSHILYRFLHNSEFEARFAR